MLLMFDVTEQKRCEAHKTTDTKLNLILSKIYIHGLAHMIIPLYVFVFQFQFIILPVFHIYIYNE